MSVAAFLDKSGISYETSEHHPTFTAQRIAAVEHEPGRFVAKPVIINVDGKYMMCVLAACSKIDLRSLKNQLGANSIELVDESVLSIMFEDCELGAEPPFGNLYDLPTIMDKALTDDDHILFQANTHERAIRMKMADYRAIVQPKVLDFSYHTS